jgi:hypothetical protein
MYPPSSGPQIGATSEVMDHSASAVARRLAGKIEIINAWEPGMIGPETRPCRVRKATSDSRLQAMPQRKDATVKSAMEARKVFTTP